MATCPITLKSIPESQGYSDEGLRGLHPKLRKLLPLELSHHDQLREARLRADKMSVQGVQPKLSAKLRIEEGRFEIVDRGGDFLLKPNPLPFEEVPANEALTMTLASLAGIEVPPHGLVRSQDGQWTYLIKRFDRRPRGKKQHVEDFAQLSGTTRDTKYESSLERVAAIVEKHCTFPAIEKPRLARRLLFCFLTGNEDMHLKNFSLIVNDGIVSLSPAYDLLNTTLVLEKAVEESALPLGGKKRKLTRKLWIDYFCKSRLSLSEKAITQIFSDFEKCFPRWIEALSASYLSQEKQESYCDLLEKRRRILGLNHS